MPKGGRGSDWTDKVIKAVELEEDLLAELDKYAGCKREVSEVIDTIEDECCHLVMTLYYVRALPTWRDVANAVPCDESTVYRWRDIAMRQIEPAILERIACCE